MNISWGKVTIKVRPYKATAYGSGDTWTELSVPVEGSTQMNITEGETKEAKQEGGAIVDSVTGDNTYELVFRLFVKKSDAAQPYPIEVVNGKTTVEYAAVLIPEDAECVGIDMPRANVRCIEQFSSDEGITLEYHFKAILDDVASNVNGHYGNGKLINLVVPDAAGSNMLASPSSLNFPADAGALGVILVNAGSAPTASGAAAWITPTLTQNAVIFTVSANTGSARTSTVTLTDSNGKTCNVVISQAAGN